MKTDVMKYCFAALFATLTASMPVVAGTLSDDDLTSPDGTIFGEFGTKNQNGAFDNDTTSDSGRWLVHNTSDFYIGYDFGDGHAQIVNRIKVHPSTNNRKDARTLKSFTLYGTNDDNLEDRAQWVELRNVSNIAGSDWGTDPKEYSVTNGTAYRAYIFYVVENNTDEYTQIHELEYFHDVVLPSVAEGSASIVSTGAGALRVSFETATTNSIGGCVAFSARGFPDVLIPVGAKPVGSQVDVDISVADGFDERAYYSARIVLDGTDGSSTNALPGWWCLGQALTAKTEYSDGNEYSVSAVAPFVDGNRIEVTGSGAKFKVGNSVQTIGADIAASARLNLRASNIGVLYLAGDNVFEAGLDMESIGLVIAASARSLGGVDSVFRRRAVIGIVDGFMASFGNHDFVPDSGANTGGLALELQRPDSVFVLDRTVNAFINSDPNAPFCKFGEGTLRITAPQQWYNGQVRYGSAILGGKVLLDCDAGGSLKSGKGTSVVFGGGTLEVTGRTSGLTDFAVYNVSLNGYWGNNGQSRVGSGRLVLDANGGMLTASLNEIDFGGSDKPFGRSLDISTKGNVTATTITANDEDGALLNHRVTFNGANWACVDSEGVIGAFSGYSDSFASGGNVAISGSSALAESATVESLKIDASEGGSLAIAESATLTLDSGALLVTGTGDYTISGGAIAGNWPADPNSEVLINHQGSGRLVLDCDVANAPGDTQRSVLTKSGPGTLVLGRNTTHQGEIVVNEGVLEISAHRQLGYYSNKMLMLLGGTLRVTDNVTLEGFDQQNARSVLIGTAGGTFDVRNGKKLRIQGSLYGQAIGGTTNGSGLGALHLANSDGGAGELSISEYKFTGGIFIDCGVLRLSKTDGCVNVNPVYFGNGATTVLQLNGNNPTFAGLYGGTSASAVENYVDSTKAATLRLEVGGDAVFAGALRDAGAHPLSLVKLGAGVQAFQGASSHTGASIVSNGTLLVNGSFSGSGVATVAPMGTLGGTGSIASDVAVSAGGAIMGGNGTTPGTLSVGSLSCDAGSILKAVVSGNAASRVSVGGNATLSGIVEVAFEGVPASGRYTLLDVKGDMVASSAELRSLDPSVSCSLSVSARHVVLKVGSDGMRIIVR